MSRFLLIGFDGAEPALVERWMDEGHLPNLSALRERGTYVPCASTTPPATFPAWTTCVTGVNPGQHGVFDFTAMNEGEYALRFVNATARKAPALWEVLSKEGKRVCVLGVPATYPPDKVNGVMVSGFDSPVCTSVDRSFVYPPEYYSKVKDWRFADFQETDIGDGWHAAALPKLLQGIATKERIACDLMAQEPWDFFMMVFGESDTVAHHFWMYHDPESPRHQPGFEDAIRQVYVRLDEALGRLIEASGDDVVVGVVSDHGFGGAGTGVVHLNNWLAQEGHLHFENSRDSLLKRLGLSLVPDRWKGALFRKLTNLASRAESQSRFGGIDWSATSAWSEELNYFPSIRVNLQGREPEGRVPPTEYDAFCDDLCRRLEAWEPVKKAWRRDALYNGSCVERAPDILLELELDDGYSHSCLRGRGGDAFRRLASEEHMGGKERGMNGNHRPTGVFFLSEASTAASASLLDIAPTVYASMGVPGPAMEGVSVHAEVETRAFENERGETGYTPEQAEIVEARLRDLGYFE